MNPEWAFDCCADVPAEERTAAMEELIQAVEAIHARRGLPPPSWVDDVRRRLQAGGIEAAADLPDQ